MFKTLGNIKISKKLAISYSVLCIFTLIVGIVGMSGIFNIKNADAKLYEEYTAGLQHAGNAAVDFQQLRYDTYKLRKSEGSEQSEIDTLVASMRKSVTELQNHLKSCDETLVTEEFRTQIKDIEANWEKYTVLLNENLDAAGKNDFDTLKANATSLGDIGTTIRDEFTTLFDALSQRASEKSNSNAVLANVSALIAAVAIAISIVIAVIMVMVLSRNVAYPLTKIALVAEKLAVGDMDIGTVLGENDYDVKNRKDEIGILALTFNKLIAASQGQTAVAKSLAVGDLTCEVSIRSEKDALGLGIGELIENLNKLVSDIAGSAEQVETGANQVSNHSMTLSQGATEQASSVEELTASLAQISTQTNTNAVNAERASVQANNARMNAEKGNEKMRELQNAMNEINESSGRINRIIKVIDDIAFQTNILALNAAVEAARAGQYGKGFAVVADEVRTLAAKSADAAKETTEMIEGSIRTVEAGTKIADETAEELGSIVAQVKEAADLVDQISNASQEQAIGIEQINQGIIQVSMVTQTNAATSEETAAASEELTGHAAQLREIIRFFKTKA